MAFDIKAWTDYGVAVVGGAATLTGLLFVAVSVNSAWFYSSEAHRGRAGQALVLFVVPLVSGILLVIPGQSPTIARCRDRRVRSCSWAACCSRSVPTQSKTSHDRWCMVDRLSPRLITTIGLIVGGVSLIVGHFGGLYWLAGVHVCALLAGLLNAWVFLLAAGAEKVS